MAKIKYWIMITTTVLAVGAVLLWLCDRGPEKVTAFLPGVYVCEHKNDFCQIDDTLTIRRAKLNTESYIVTRTTRFTRIGKGKKTPAEVDVQRWTANYDKRWSQLVSGDSANIIGYFPFKNFLNKGDFFYEKIE